MARPSLPLPSYLSTALEPMAWLEYSAFLGSRPLLRCAPDGDGHPVLVLPGFTGSDRSTGPLRSVLRRKGYWVHGWQLGANTGPHAHIVDGVERRLVRLHERHGTTVSLVGWSLGGVFARELARAHPEAVRQVITLGSPFRFRVGDRSRASLVYDLIGPLNDGVYGGREPEHGRAPLPVPTTAIYSRYDGIVRWSACIEAAGPRRENIEVIGTHSGLGFNFGAVWATLDRLSRPETGWTPFRPPLALRHLYGTPAVWDPVRGRATD